LPLKMAVSAKRLAASIKGGLKLSTSQFRAFRSGKNKKSDSCFVLLLIRLRKPIYEQDRHIEYQTPLFVSVFIRTREIA
jgi:hypothetical protein